uniref:Uncharacterized protein n=1 Tax=Cacopsylla melanoneura TaxID=428564 RepID=A0A8D9E3F0_9HEMI
MSSMNGRLSSLHPVQASCCLGFLLSRLTASIIQQVQCIYLNITRVHAPSVSSVSLGYSATSVQDWLRHSASCRNGSARTTFTGSPRPTPCSSFPPGVTCGAPVSSFPQTSSLTTWS